MLFLEPLEPRCLLSISISETVFPYDDQEILFFDTGVGQASLEEKVFVFNIALDQANITELSLEGINADSFSLQYTATQTPPAGFVLDEAIELEIGVPYLDGEWLPVK